MNLTDFMLPERTTKPSSGAYKVESVQLEDVEMTIAAVLYFVDHLVVGLVNCPATCQMMNVHGVSH